RLGREYHYVDSTPSTQLLIPPGASEGTLVVAGEQTEGRGRLGRRWLAPAGTSLLCSLQLRPDVPGERLPELTGVAARASAGATAPSCSWSCSSNWSAAMTSGSAVRADDAAPVAGRVNGPGAQRAHGSATDDAEDPRPLDVQPLSAAVQHEREPRGLVEPEAE